MKFSKLDPLLNTPVRLAVVSILSQLESADFRFLKEQTDTTQGNLSHQLKKLKEAAYIKVKKSFENNYPKTTCSLSPKGRKAFEDYIEAMKPYLNLGK